MTFKKAREYNRCEYRNCNKYLKEKYDQWFLTINGILKVFCQKHYDIKEKEHNKKR